MVPHVTAKKNGSDNRAIGIPDGCANSFGQLPEPNPGRTRNAVERYGVRPVRPRTRSIRGASDGTGTSGP
ncbi:hypothetical protein EDD40_5195 [Saccharothrix texasensis]|uniref:Uncharacterized protein n=1 Tax=Saccharothrix texasensis TaxID=103734 RepID=A0A3N1HBC5_9PSEU|nr:hypothetical protein EDD40_5195 [Saccharothrix texasensis]